MACHKPLNAWKSRELDDTNPDTGKTKYVFSENKGLKSSHVELPCGQCIGCRMDRARSWAVRCVHEAQLHQENCFVTLTYDDTHCPTSLQKDDMTKFLKRLRKHFPDKTIRYFQCGEYGDLNGRPHHHIILFGLNFPDRAHFKRHMGNNLYLSLTLSELWPYGMHSIGELTFQSACYTARYILKKVTGKYAKTHYGTKTPEYCTMSLKPGIGKAWFDKYKSDVYNHDRIVLKDSLICRPPKYYDRMFDLDNPATFESIKAKRLVQALNNPENNDDRRTIKHEIALIKQAKLERL